MTAPVLSAKALSFSYGKKEVFSSLSFSVEKGEILGIAGANGSGKTTLIRCLLGLVPFRGGIAVCGTDLSREREKALSEVGGFCDDAFFLPHLTGKENLTLTAVLAGKGKEETDRAELCSGLAERIEEKVSAYSCGMKKRLQFALALLRANSLLLLDEPLQALDPDGIFLTRRILKEEAKNGKAVVFCDHSLREMEAVCDRILFLKNGRFAGEWKKGGEISAEEIYRQSAEAER